MAHEGKESPESSKNEKKGSALQRIEKAHQSTPLVNRSSGECSLVSMAFAFRKQLERYKTSISKRCTYFFPLVGRERFRSSGGRGFGGHRRHRGERGDRRRRSEEREAARGLIPELLQKLSRRGDDGDGGGGLAEALDEEESRGRESHKRKSKRRGKKVERGRTGEREERRSCFSIFLWVRLLRVFSFSPRFGSKREAEDAGFVATAALSLWWA